MSLSTTCRPISSIQGFSLMAGQQSIPLKVAAGCELSVLIPTVGGSSGGTITVDYTQSVDDAVISSPPTAVWTNAARTYTVSTPAGSPVKIGQECWLRFNCVSGSGQVSLDPSGTLSNYKLAPFGGVVQVDPVSGLSYANSALLNYVTQDADGFVHATIIPRTNTLANLTALMSGGGELASATDKPCIVQLNGTPGSGTAAVYSPMGPGFWSDAVGARADQRLQAQTGTGVSGQTGGGRNLLLSGGPGSATGTNKVGGLVIITGGLSPTAGQGGGAQLRAGANSGEVGLAGSDGTNIIYVDVDDLLYVSPDVFPDSDPGAEGALYKTVISGVTVLAVSQG